MSSTLLRIFLISTAVMIAYFVLMRPRELRRLGRGLRLVAFAYVLAVIISALLRLTVGWGT